MGVWYLQIKWILKLTLRGRSTLILKSGRLKVSTSLLRIGYSLPLPSILAYLQLSGVLWSLIALTNLLMGLLLQFLRTGLGPFLPIPDGIGTKIKVLPWRKPKLNGPNSLGVLLLVRPHNFSSCWLFFLLKFPALLRTQLLQCMKMIFLIFKIFSKQGRWSFYEKSVFTFTRPLLYSP